jgi:hypothetical protein
MRRKPKAIGRRPQQAALFAMIEDDGDVADDLREDPGDLRREVGRMTLETSSQVYAQRRAQW